MSRKAVSTVAIFMVAGTVSACNSTDNPYRRGPWGTASTPRSYPAYSGPWGRPPVGALYEAAVQPAYAPLHIAETPLHASRNGHEVQLEPELPPGPLPDRSVSQVGSELGPLPSLSVEQSASAQGEANAQVGASAPGIFTPPQRPSSYAGTWKANVGAASCRIQLSSVPSLDLYKASAQGCSSNSLKAVNGWSIRDNQVILFSRGEVIARLSGAEAALSGRINGSETEMTMTR
ncbi:hypothetical protein FHR70_000343 [Microvirga lupini]|uniref:Alkaline proteinase inhibitor/ Outer membrane lipoprotein Omp19 domain-containing protein n=1 Tax=Microvirga lupini TaxID=420324 RepID=A0A7W4YVT2_9HYPH|nr:hypothetical protein [Microvirga lupini]